MKKIKINYKLIGILLFVILAGIIFFKFPIFKDLIGVIIAAFIITYSLRPIQKILIHKGINRKLSSLILIIGIFIIILGMMAALVPWIYSESSNFAKAFEGIKEYYNKVAVEMRSIANIEFVQELLQNSYGRAKRIFETLTNNLITEVISMAENLFLMCIIPILVYFFLSDGNNISDGIIKYLPVSNKYALRNMVKHIDKVMERYIITQFELCGIIGILTFIVLVFSKVKYSFLLALLNAIFNIIPYFGPIIGAVPIILIALLTSTKKAIIVAFWLMVIQQVEGDIIGPKILGETVNSHPVTILLLLIIGGSIGGIVGMIFVIPTWTMVKIVISEVEAYLF